MRCFSSGPADSALLQYAMMMITNLEKKAALGKDKSNGKKGKNCRGPCMRRKKRLTGSREL